MMTGSSRPVCTYDNPSLSTQVEFEVEHVEVWALCKNSGHSEEEPVSPR